MQKPSSREPSELRPRKKFRFQFKLTPEDREFNRRFTKIFWWAVLVVALGLLIVEGPKMAEQARIMRHALSGEQSPALESTPSKRP